MEMIYATKINETNNSFKTTIPKPLIKLVGLEDKDSLRWNIEVKPEGVVITVVPQKSLDNLKRDRR